MFMEDNIFEILIPMENVATLQVGPGKTNKETNKEAANKIVEIIKETPEISVY